MLLIRMVGAVLLITSCLFIQAANADERAQFKTLYSQLKSGKSADITPLSRYILFPYLQYRQLLQNFNKKPVNQIRNFMSRHADSPLSDTVRIRLMERMVDEQSWTDVIKLAQTDDGIKAQCMLLQARLSLGEINSVLSKAKEIWLSGKDRPGKCDAIFKILKSQGQLSTDDYRQRIDLALDKGSRKLATSLASNLPRSERATIQRLVKAHNNPTKALRDKALNQDTAGNRRVIAYALARLARKDSKKAREQQRKYLRSHSFSIQRKVEMNRDIALQEALDHEPTALDDLLAVPPKYHTEKTLEWAARMALRQGNWKKLLEVLDALPANKQEDRTWRYWRARALEARKQRTESRKIYSTLTDSASFYGLLAADHLNQPYDMIARRAPQLDHIIPDLKLNPGIRRALELLAVDFKLSARKEWFKALEGSDKNTYLAAAKLAQQNGHHFTAIITISRTKDWNQVELRFPLAYKDLIEKIAPEQGVPPELVYAVSRRESAFDPNIVSSAKAQGLMQLIPPTAKHVARRLGIKRLSRAQTFIPETNITLGSAYLAELLEKFDNNLTLATASYNAGPHRMPKWAPDYPLEAARWIESIPFNETRNYVQAVMAYMVIYDYKLKGDLNQVTRLSKRLRPVLP